MYEIIGSYGTKYFVDRVEYIFYDKNGQYKNVFDFAFCTILQNEYKKYLEIDFPNEKGIN